MTELQLVPEWGAVHYWGFLKRQNRSAGHIELGKECSGYQSVCKTKVRSKDSGCSESVTQCYYKEGLNYVKLELALQSTLPEATCKVGNSAEL